MAKYSFRRRVNNAPTPAQFSRINYNHPHLKHCKAWWPGVANNEAFLRSAPAFNDDRSILDTIVTDQGLLSDANTKIATIDGGGISTYVVGTELTISFQFKFKAVSQSYTYFVGTQDYHDFSIYFARVSNYLTLRWNSTSGGSFYFNFSAGDALEAAANTAGVENHITVTLNTSLGVAELWLNEIFIDTVDLSTDVGSAPTDTFGIGNRVNSTDRYIDGFIRNVRIFDRILDDKTIVDIHRNPWAPYEKIKRLSILSLSSGTSSGTSTATAVGASLFDCVGSASGAATASAVGDFLATSSYFIRKKIHQKTKPSPARFGKINYNHPQLRDCTAWWPGIANNGTYLRSIPRYNDDRPVSNTVVTENGLFCDANNKLATVDGGGISTYVGGTELTISFQYEFTAVTQQYTYFTGTPTFTDFSIYFNRSSNYLRLAWNGYYFTFTWSANDALDNAANTSRVENHITITLNTSSGLANLWLNGLYYNTVNLTTDVGSAPADTFGIGNRVSATNRYIDGFIRNFRVYDKILDVQSILDVHHRPWAPYDRVKLLSTNIIDQAEGSSAGDSAATAVGQAQAEADGSSSGASTASGVGSSLAEADGSCAGTSTASGVGNASFYSVGSSAGTSTASGAAVSTGDAAGSSAGVATASGVGQSIAESAGSSDGTSTAEAVTLLNNQAVGSSVGTSTASAVGQWTANATGTSSGESEAAGVAVIHATGSSDGIAVVHGVSVALIEQGSGGWVFWSGYEREILRRKQEEKKRKELELKAKKLKNKLERELALQRAKERRERDRIAELKRLTRLVGKFQRDLKDEANDRVLTAAARAFEKGSYSAMEALDRELAKLKEEEEFLEAAAKMLLYG